ncbi:MAG TPA: SusC/RagA family TonB-linked outer membrane protein [Chitinophagaceae bacterium]
MKHLLLALGASMIITAPALAAPTTDSDPLRKEFFQNKPITGKVTDDKGEPLPGVTVQVKGLKTSTVTGADGEFTITVPNDAATLVFSYVGMERKEVSIGGKANFQIQLKSLDATLSDVVVVGYSAQKKAHLTGAVSSIKASEVEDLPVSNMGAALAGRVLGLGVSGGTGRPGEAAKLTIRNPMSLAKDGGNTDPLFVIDGVLQLSGDGSRSDNTLFNSLDPSEVETITILKDAAAAIYGARGANGVVLVTTKRGKAGPPRITYSGSYGINDESYRTKMMSAYEFAQYMNIMNGPNGQKKNPATDKDNFFTQDELDHFKNINHDWLEPAWSSSYNMRHTLNVSGGANRATYFAGMSFYEQDGNISSLKYNKWTYRAGADVTLATNLKAGLQVSGNYSDRVKTFNKIGGENDENDYRNLLLAPRYIPMYVDGLAVKLPGTDQLSRYHFYEIERLGNLAQSKDRSMNLNLFAEYELPFVKGLKARAGYARNFGNGVGSQVGTKYTLNEFTGSGTFQHIYDDGNAKFLKGTVWENGDRLYYSNRESDYSQVNFTMNYGRKIGRHDINGVFAFERSESSSGQYDVWKEDPVLTTNGQFTTAFGDVDGRTSGTEAGSMGYIARINYAFADKYLAEFQFRTDASTKFAPENYWGRFYSGSFGWVVSNENFFRVPAINFLKLRYSAGLLGRDDTRAWQWRQRYTFQGGKGAVFGGNSELTTGMKMEAAPNRNATWSDEFKNNLGLDARFLNHRLSATVEAFYNMGTNMLIERTGNVPITVGGSIAAENWAKVNFFGYELGLGWNDKIGRDFNYGIDVRFGWNDNKVKQGNFNAIDVLYPWNARPNESSDNGVWGHDYLGMFHDQQEIDAYVKEYNISSVVLGSTTVLAKDLKPGMLYYRDVRGALQPDGSFAGPDGIINSNDQVQIAKKKNNHYGFGTTLKAGYKGFSLDAVVSGSFGGWSEIDGLSRKRLNPSISRNFQSRPAYWGNIYDPVLNPGGVYPNPYWEDISLNATSDFWSVSGFRMYVRNINLNYSIPKRMAEAVKMNNARVYLSVLNPVILYNPYDYKAPDGAYDTFPDLKTYSLGVNLTF